MKQKTIVIYPIAWEKTLLLFAESGPLNFPLQNWQEPVQEALKAMAAEGLIKINKKGSLRLLAKGKRHILIMKQEGRA